MVFRQKANARKHDLTVTLKHEIHKERQMPSKKATDLSLLLAVKGKATAAAAPTLDAPEQIPDALPSKKKSPLNFKVDPAFRRRFRMCAADADLKHNELLLEALDAWEEQRKKRGTDDH
jgi:hypothetical protein